jgi:hypothetical protein
VWTQPPVHTPDCWSEAAAATPATFVSCGAAGQRYSAQRVSLIQAVYTSPKEISRSSCVLWQHTYPKWATLNASSPTSSLRVQHAHASEDKLGVAPSHEDAELLARPPSGLAGFSGMPELAWLVKKAEKEARRLRSAELQRRGEACRAPAAVSERLACLYKIKHARERLAQPLEGVLGLARARPPARVHEERSDSGELGAHPRESPRVRREAG